MKTLHTVLFFTLLGISLSSKFTEDLLWPSDKECIKELGLEVQTVLDSVNDDFLTTEGDTTINQYTECSYRKLNVIDENNEIKYDELKPIFDAYIEVVDKDIADQGSGAGGAIESCKNLKGDSLGDRLVKFSNCVVKKVKII